MVNSSSLIILLAKAIIKTLQTSWNDGISFKLFISRNFFRLINFNRSHIRVVNFLKLLHVAQVTVLIPVHPQIFNRILQSPTLKYLLSSLLQLVEINMLAASCSNNLQQVCKHQVASSLVFTGLLQLEKFIRLAASLSATCIKLVDFIKLQQACGVSGCVVSGLPQGRGINQAKPQDLTITLEELYKKLSNPIDTID